MALCKADRDRPGIPGARILLILGLLLASSAGCAEEPISHTAPTRNDGAKWRIGYYEGGPWRDYQSELLSLVDGLAALGWLEAGPQPTPPNNQDTAGIWSWLSTAVQSDYLTFVPEAYWSANWEDNRREANRTAAIETLQAEELDLVIAMGTWAGLDLANDLHSVPTIVMSTSNPIEAGIIPGPEDSGHPHVHARCDPEEQIREIRTFHDIIGFNRIGVIYDYGVEDSRVYAAVPELETVAAEKGFHIISCDAQEYNLPQERLEAGVLACLETLAPQIDAFYISAHQGMAVDAMPGLFKPLFNHNVPVLAPEGQGLVERGAMLSVARGDTTAIGLFQATILAEVLNGARPGDLNQVFEEPKRIAVNLETARRIGYDLPPGLVKSANQVFEHIEHAEQLDSP